MRPVPLSPTKDQIKAGLSILKGRPLTTDARITRAVIDLYETMIALAPQATTGGLLRNQQIALELICDHIDQHGHAPSLVELSKLMGRDKAAAYRTVKNMVKRGYLARGHGWRNLTVLKRYDGQPVNQPVTSKE